MAKEYEGGALLLWMPNWTCQYEALYEGSTFDSTCYDGGCENGGHWLWTGWFYLRSFELSAKRCMQGTHTSFMICVPAVRSSGSWMVQGVRKSCEDNFEGLQASIPPTMKFCVWLKCCQVPSKTSWACGTWARWLKGSTLWWERRVVVLPFAAVEIAYIV